MIAAGIVEGVVSLHSLNPSSLVPAQGGDSFEREIESASQSFDGGKGAAKASRSSVFAATSPDLANVSGQYYDTNSKRAKFHKSVMLPDNQRRVMQTIERYVASIQ